MKVIKPSTVVDASIVSSSIPEPSTYDNYQLYGVGALLAPTLWNGASTSYILGQRVYRTTTHRIYEALGAIAASGANLAPELCLEDTVVAPTVATWVQVGPTNKWAMFDDEIASTSQGVTSVSVVLKTSQINSIAMFGLVGLEATVELSYGTYPGTTVYGPITVPLQGAAITDWYDYFFAEFRQIEQFVLTDLPVYYDGNITVTVTGPEVAIGQLVVGYASYLGTTDYGSTSGIIDYSRKEANTFGNVTFIQRNFSKRMSAKMTVDNTSVDTVQTKLASLRATPCVWVGTDEATYNNLVVFGWYKDFSIDVENYSTSSCTLEIEGLV